MKVRTATRADAPALLEIYRPFVTDTAVSFELEPPTVAEFQERIAASVDKWGWLVAEQDGLPAGYAYAGSFRTRAAYRFSCEVSAYVHPDFRGRGVARRLYDELLVRLVERGYCTAYAGIVLPNDASVGLHRALGFQPVGVFQRAGWKFGRWHDVSWWQRPLRDAPP